MLHSVYPHRQCNIGDYMSSPKEISYDRVNELFYYDRDTDLLIRHSIGYRRDLKTDESGYVRLRVDGRYLREHRIIYLLNNPTMDQSLQIDHINGIKTDNRISNLRLVTATENLCNATRAKGYSWDKRSKRFRSYIQIHGKTIHLGSHYTILDARAAYLRAKKKYHIIEER